VSAEALLWKMHSLFMRTHSSYLRGFEGVPRIVADNLNGDRAYGGKMYDLGAAYASHLAAQGEEEISYE